MEKLTQSQIARNLGWSRQVLEYWVKKKMGRVPIEKALAIQNASRGQYKVKDLCTNFKKTAKEVLKAM
jgi:DNA-binding transcriptional regulator YdaS (Cro superfamily)